MLRTLYCKLYCTLHETGRTILSSLTPPTLANQGVNWLTAQAQPDGHYSTPNDLDLPFIATVETLHTLYELGETEPSMTAALQAINAVTQLPIGELSTETLAKILIIGAKASQPVDALATELLTRLNHYGGLGDLRDYDSSVIDTSAALTALAQSQNVDTALETLYPTIDLLLKQQHEDGGWADNGNDSSVYVTAITMHALWHYRHKLKNILTRNLIPALDKAQAYLLHELNQGENDTFEIALALIAILPRLSNQDDIANPLTALRAAQLANGSWDNDVYTTALALRAIHLADNPPANPDLGKLQGIVMDATNNAPLPNVAIVATFGEQTLQLTTHSDGTFEIKDLVALEGQLSFTIEGYAPLNFPIALLDSGEIFDLGQVRLRPEIGEPLLPDLVITKVGPDIPISPQTLMLSGQLNAEIKNAGTAPTSQQIKLIAFYDANQDGLYQTDSDDSLLGESVINPHLAVDEILSVAIPVAGQLPFRDAPITVMVDSRQIITELEEKNNVGISSKICQVIPDIRTFEPVLKWEWTGSSIFPSSKQVVSLPIVAPLEDTNGDGNINALDIPSVIFHTYDYNYDTGYLRAVSGQDGRELWTVSNPDYKTYPIGSLAVADIDQDGKIEIIAPKPSGKGLIAFEHTGDFKWENTLPEINIIWGGGASIADLDADNNPEIIIGNTVLNADGSLRWKGVGFSGMNMGIGPISVVADINLDGKPEIIAGAAAYSNTGQRLWQNSSVGDGYVAIGNFNDDDYPEIVVIHRGRISLLNYLGERIWGPISLRGGAGGPPTVADMNGDGIPEIGVAGVYQYIVFTAMGAELWSNSIRESSSVTGSSVFDFDGDGVSEVVYADEYYLQVFLGSDGTLLFKIPNTSQTGNQLPVIADVDGDNHADIVVCTDSYYGGGSGIRVFQDKNNSWVNTRKIWNQHSYHITNINDDGTVPAVEQNSWQVHNTYRLNTIPGQYVTGIPDLTAGRLQIIDNGAGKPFTLQARIGNAGLAPSTANLPLTFYAGDPTDNGTKLGTVMLEVFEPGTYQDVQLEGVTLSDLNQDIYAVVDAQNTLEECNESNNSVSTSVSEGTPTRHGEVSITTDAPTYGPNMPVVIDYTITNLGALPADFKVTLRLENTNNAVLETFSTPTLETLASGDSQSFQATWNTGTTLAGHYQIHALIETADGELVTEVIYPFTITAATEGPIVTLRTTTDKPTYHTNDVVLINHLLNNASLNTLIEDALLTVTIKGPEGQVVHTESQALKPLSPQALQNLLTPFKLQEAEKGSYTVTVSINGHDDTPLITQTTTFQVENDLKFSIDGQVQTESAQLTRGKTQHCTATVTNQGTEKVSGLAVQYLLINLDTQATVNTQTATIDLAIGGSHTQTAIYDTLSLPITHYACVVQAKIGEEWQPLDFKTFNLHSILSSECSTVYAIHDQARSDTQLFSYDLNTGNINPLGPLYPERDLEGLDIHPHNHQLYASTGQPQSRLEQVNGYSGDLTPIGYIGFKHVTSLSFHPSGQLWGGAQGGLIQINTDTGQGQMIKPNNLKMEGLSWNNAGTLLYATAVIEPNPHSSLWVYDPQTTELRKHCDNLEGEIESLETLPDDRLAFGIHDDQALSFHVFDPEQCQTVQGSRIQTPYNDIEAIAWPSANCTFMQKALQAFFITLSENQDIYLGEDRNLRVSIDGQIYQGQLALEKTQGLPPSDGQLHLTGIADANQDGIDDFLITYPDGQQQILYYQELTEE